MDGRPILVVEEEFLIALDLQRMLEEMGAGQILFCRTPSEADQFIASWSTIALAIVGTRTGDQTGDDLVATLTASGIPVVLTGSTARTRKESDDGSRISAVAHPISERDLARAITEILAMDG